MLRQASLAVTHAYTAASLETSKLVPWVILGGCWAMDSLDNRGQNQASKYTRTPAPGGGWLLVARNGTSRGSRCVGAFTVGALGAEMILRQTLVSEAWHWIAHAEHMHGKLLCLVVLDVQICLATLTRLPP